MYLPSYKPRLTWKSTIGHFSGKPWIASYSFASLTMRQLCCRMTCENWSSPQQLRPTVVILEFTIWIIHRSKTHFFHHQHKLQQLGSKTAPIATTATLVYWGARSQTADLWTGLGNPVGNPWEPIKREPLWWVLLFLAEYYTYIIHTKQI